MTTIIAAIDSSAAAKPVLDTALGLSELLGAEVEGVHAVDGDVAVPELLAERAAVPLRLLPPPADVALVEELRRPEVLLEVLGARSTPGGRRPVGSTASFVLRRAVKPVVTVPPQARIGRPLRRLLLPLEGTEISSMPLVEVLKPMLESDVELNVLHVFTDATLPRMLDRPIYDLELLGREFLAIHCPTAELIDFRPGPVGPRIVEVCKERDVDLIVLSWSQSSGPGRADVVREVLGASNLPVMLIPGPR